MLKNLFNKKATQNTTAMMVKVFEDGNLIISRQFDSLKDAQTYADGLDLDRYMECLITTVNGRVIGYRQ